MFAEVSTAPLADVAAGWKDFVMELPEPVTATWIILTRGDLPPEIDVQSGDRLVSVAGRPIQNQQGFSAAVAELAYTADPVSVVCYRNVAVDQSYRMERVETTLKPAQLDELLVRGTEPRKASLID